MDTPKQQQSAHLLDDLESIRQLLGDDNLQPPLLTDTVEDDDQEQIPMLFDAVSASRPTSNRHHPPLPPSLHLRPIKARTPCCIWTANCAPPPC